MEIVKLAKEPSLKRIKCEKIWFNKALTTFEITNI